MKKVLIMLSVIASAFIAGQDYSLAQQERTTQSAAAQQRAAAQEKRAQTQVQRAVGRINDSRKLRTQIAELGKKNDLEGINRLLIANGAPASTRISAISGTPSPTQRIRIRCTITCSLNSCTITCTISW